MANPFGCLIRHAFDTGFEGQFMAVVNDSINHNLNVERFLIVVNPRGLGVCMDYGQEASPVGSM